MNNWDSSSNLLEDIQSAKHAIEQERGGREMRVARLTEQGIMVNPEALHKLGPIDGAIAIFADCLDKTIKYYSVQYEGKRSIHLVIDPPNGEMRVQCGLPAEGKATIWNFKEKEITCKKCKKTVDGHGKEAHD